MKLFKNVLSLLLASAIAFGSIAAYAEAPEDTSQGTVSQDEPPQEEQDKTSEKKFDTSDTAYQPADLKGWVRWDGTEFKENTSYYIDGIAKIGQDSLYTLPASSRLLVCEGAQLLIYVGGRLQIGGVMTVAPGAEFTCSGTLSVLKGGAFESFGNTAFTVSSTVNISSDFVVRSGSVLKTSGTVNVYKEGGFIGYGETTATKSAQIMLTGVWQAPESGKLFLMGKMTVTLSGRFNATGYMSLSGELVNSGMAIFGENVKFFKTASATFSVTKSGRVIDYRSDVENASTGSYRSGIKGIDVSVWQGVIDWQRVKNSGVQFAMIRSSYSDDSVDKMFEYNITEAQKAGIPVGVYHYCYALTPEQARIEARFFIETISPYKIEYPVMFDFEDNSQARLGKTQLTNIALAFMDELDKAGYYGMIYSYKNWLTDNLDMSKLSKYEVAVAEWNVSHSTYRGNYGMWQYSAKGLVSGIEGDVDLDLCYKDYQKLIRLGGYNHLDDFDNAE